MTDDRLSRSETSDSTAPPTSSTASTRSTASSSEPATIQTFIYTTDESVSEAVLDAVASITDSDPIELDPLYYTIDPDALDTLFESRPYNTELPRDVQVTFSYVGLQVTVTAAGQIIVEDEGPDVD
ncbi:hypothetical protein OB955_17275 [Halobacteria archaeon AArc-m2/3/4]|uniref:Halobacterial output domain-containing protein n=1 Tax=Natronoglomus mannanivorans TaxID=2979990 RepID=A0ABT2QHR0_9EURY|nr:hypothetical protein [Halobacteria archaeon AArc-m2/3/4]